MLAITHLTSVLAALSLSPSLSKPSSSPSPPNAKTSRHLNARANCAVEPYNNPIGEQHFPPFNPSLSQIYRYRRQQGVNLGSWFVHENWMTPSLFSCAAAPKLSELDIAHSRFSPSPSPQINSDTANAKAKLEKHWDTFISASDFSYLASIGINTVRLPIGFWHLPGFCTGTVYEDVSDVYKDAWPRIVRAINMAGEHGIGVLVDLHGAVGSQNGQPHSGISDGQTRLFTSKYNVDKTLDALRFLGTQLSNVTNVVGIQLLNEPQYVDQLEGFYAQAINAIRSLPADVAPEAKSVPLYLHNGFSLSRFTPFLLSPALQNAGFIVQDHHSYFVFTPQDSAESASAHTKDVTTSVEGELGDASSKTNVIVGEWSCALTPESLANDPGAANGGKDGERETRRRFCEAQMEVYANVTGGWSFWSYKKEDCKSDPGWCFSAAVDQGVLPATFFSYESQREPVDAERMLASLPAPDLAHVPVTRDIGTQTSLRTRTNKRLSIPHLRVRQQQAQAEGYKDGYETAVRFAREGNWSKVGFVRQFVGDLLNEKKTAGRGYGEGEEEGYREGFGRGLAEGEGRVEGVLGRRG